MAENTITPPRTSVPNSGASSGGGLSEWVSNHKGLAIGGLLAAAVGAYLLLRSRSSSSSSTQNSTTATPSTLYPYSTGVTGDTNTGDYYAGILNQLNSNSSALSSQLTGLQTALTSAINAGTAAGNPSTGATNNGSTSGSTAAAATPGYGEINLPGIGESVILGRITSPGNFTGYNVGGGAPVYFGNANSVAQGSAGEQVAGNYAYTPVQYSGLVGSTVSSEVL